MLANDLYNFRRDPPAFGEPSTPQSSAPWANLLQVILSEPPGPDPDFQRLRPLHGSSLQCCDQPVDLPAEDFMTYTSKPGDIVAPVPNWRAGKVVKATHDDKTFGVKRLRVYSTDNKPMVVERFCREAILWKSLEHPNILPLLCVGTGPLILVSMWMENGNIIDYLRMKPEVNRVALLSDTAEGLAYLHSHEITHGDLKGTNVLINDDGRANVSDFGLSTIRSRKEPTHSFTSAISCGGTLRWTAPEILEGTGSISKPADVYAFGMLAFEVFAGTVPFADSPPTTVAVQVLTGERPKRPTHPSLTDQVWYTILRCWTQDPSLRPETQEVLSQLRRLSMTPQCSVDPSCFQAKEGTTSLSILREVFKRPGRGASWLLGLFSRFRGSGLETPPSPNTYDIKGDFFNSSSSVDSWEK